MKKGIFLLFAAVIFTATGVCQYSVRGGMGITFQTTPSLVNYINQNFAPSNQQVAVFGSAVTFSGEFDYSLKDSNQVGLEIAYLINSYNINTMGGVFKLNYGILMPSLIYYYVIEGEGYNFKFGGGAGVRLVNLDQQLQGTPSPLTYTSTGFGLLARADGNTIISKNLYANVGLDLRYDFNGKPKSGGQYLVNYNNNSDVNLNALSIGIRLGLTYTF